MKKQILFLGGFYPDELYNSIAKNSKRGLQVAANNFQKSVIKGLEGNLKKFNVVSSPFISTYPFGYKKIYFKGSEITGLNYSGKCISFINLPIINNKKTKLTKELFEWYKNTPGEKCIIIYSLISTLMDAAIELKEAFPELALCQIVTDIPEFMGANKVYKLLGMKKKNDKWIENNLEYIDSFVLLTSAMADYLNINHKPFIVVEGIYNSSKNIESYSETSKDKIILYTGALAEKYGIIKLLDAFDSIAHDDYKLWICGAGECVQEVQKRSEKDSRIKYWGLLPVSEILIMQKKATVLVNPRPSGGEYVKYSFPSKTMEYLASGTPSIMNELEGVPSEYYDYCFVPKDETVNKLSEIIQEVCLMSTKERKKNGLRASQFIIKQKNHIVQTKKIIDLVNSV